ncbi:MAG: fimbrial protein FimV, partial [Methylococcales bacterium]|nr:fimbrial protein FimV [Methylococcales bacterium]
MKKNNVRFLTTTLAAASLLVSSSGYALGIGEMKLKSALNQNLQAEIGLVLADGENANDFKVNLAPNEKFDEAGIPWSLFLSKIKFKIVQKNGKSVIELSSSEVLKEPFLDFLIEVKSAKGNLYREFTVLIDPPSAYQATNPTPVTTQSSDPLHFVTPPASQTSGTYLTHENETLWKIAAQFNKQNNVSVHRMVAAIFVANPDAFQNSNEHTLLPNKTLKIPSVSESPELFIAVEKTVQKRPPIKKIAKPVKDKPAVSDENLASKEPKTQAVDKKITEQKLSDETQQRFAELEKQLAAMQKAIADKDLEMATLKAAEQAAPIVATSPVVTSPVVVA